MQRQATSSRTTKETDITIKLNILQDKAGSFIGSSGIGFFDHMLNAFAVHGGFDIELCCKGDLEVDGHHTVEDIGIVLGSVITEALGAHVGIARFGTAFVPMDEALSRAVVDISGRAFLVFDAKFKDSTIGLFDTSLAVEFFRAFAFGAKITLHIKNEYGDNDHHKLESIFKATAKALSAAVRIVGDQVPSTKGII